VGGSLALTVLHERLFEVQLLQDLSPVPAGSLPATPEAALAAQAINRGSVILLCSALEGFAEDLLSEAVEAMVAAGLSVSVLAPYLRQRHAERQVRELAAITDTSKFVALLKALVHDNRPLIESGRLAPGSIDVDKLRYGFATPTPDEIAKLFRMIGLDKAQVLERPFASYRMRTHVIGSISSLVEVRQPLAHGGAGSVSVTSGDVARYAGAVRVFAARLDAAVADRLRSHGVVMR
jgi:hypothetical protein